MANTALSTKAVGSKVKLKVNGVTKNFIVVHQGRPSTAYDKSCDGTWLLMEDIYELRAWNSQDINTYENSTIHSYLNSTFYNLFDADIKAKIKQVKIPYRKGGGSEGSNQTGANGLSCMIFLLSCYEVGFTKSINMYYPEDGAKLSYFDSGVGTAANNKRIANLNGKANSWWLRSPDTGGYEQALCARNTGGGSGGFCTATNGVRPALVLPSTLLVSDDGSVSTNTAPTMPASITIPISIQGGTSIQISWDASTDAENNLAGYIVERSVNGGSSWVQVYQGGVTSTTDTVPAGSDTVMYRVKAYDSEGLYSGYRNSNQVTVFNNAAPSAPGSITIPAEVLGGGTLKVSWSEASDPDNNLTGYELERQADETGEWTQVYKGADTSYTDNITRGWNSVNYRVRAYDAYDAYSPYTTGTAQPVNNNRAPIITCDQSTGADLGKKTEGFSISYTVNDEDGDSVTVTEAIDGVTVRSYAPTLANSNTFDVTGDTFFKLLNGFHTLTITASDGKAKATHKLTFTKEVTEASITLKEAFSADAKISICVLSVAGDIPADAEYKVEVTNNANDDTPEWEDCTTEVKNGGNHIFTNETAEKGFAFNFRVTVKRGSSGHGGYINSVQGGFQ